MEKQGYWTAWQRMTSRGPSRWSYNHFTKDGLTALCGKRIPRSHEVFRIEYLGYDQCKKCKEKHYDTAGPAPGEGGKV